MGFGDTIRGWLDPPVSGGQGAPSPAAASPAAASPAAASPAAVDGLRADASLVAAGEAASGASTASPWTNRPVPAVQDWLTRELPILETEGLLDPTQAAALARRYGVTVATPSAPPTEAWRVDGAAPALQSGPRDGQAVARTPVAPAPRPSLAPFLSEHAVSIVLYLGAFLVVSAVIIFLAYAWELVGGGAKVAMVAGLTAGFLLGARLCLPRPSVRPAGRTFLALGAILVPANVAAAYTFVFADGPLPQSLFWLVGAILSGGLHAALSVRLESRAYGVLAALAPPVAAGALAALLGLDDAWWPTAANLGLTLGLMVGRGRERPVLADGLQVVACGFLPVNALVGLTVLSETGAERWSAPASLLIMAGALGWLATRPGRAWLVGPVAATILAPFIVLAALLENDRAVYLGAVAVTSWLYAGIARRLPRERALLWNVAGALLAVLPPFLAWNDDRLSAGFFGSTALLLITQARASRTPLPLYPAVLMVDVLYVKLLGLIGSPESPGWVLGVALWPLALAWAAAAGFAQRHWAWPFWIAALGTGVVSVILTAERQHVSSGITASYAVVTILAAWRLAHPPVVILAVPWALIAGWQGAGWLGLDREARTAATGLVGWLFMGAAMRRGPAARTSGLSIGGGAYQWATWAWFAAGATTALAAMLVSATYRDSDAWRIQVGLAWLDLTLILAVVAWLGRSRDLAAGAALTLLPALLAVIGLAHPNDAQMYAIPAGLYLLVVGSLMRRDRRSGRPSAAGIVAGAGVATLVLTSVTPSVDTGQLAYALWGLAEGLVLVGLGIAQRWRVVVVGGAAGVVLIAVRQLFDALAALPGWVILGGSGIALLGLAVVLLLVRDRLARTGRLVAERWAGWD